MKVLHVFTIPATAEAFFDQQFGYLSENGHRITVIADAPLDQGFCRRNNIESSTAPIARKISPVSDLKAIAALRRKIRLTDYDVVVGHTPKGAMVAMIAAKLAGVKTRVYYRHGLIYTTATGFRRALLKTVERLTALCATHIVNVSPSLSELAVKDHLNPEEKQTVIGVGTCGGIDTVSTFNPDLVSISEKSALKPSLGINENDFVVGFCGRICKEKGIRELIDGFKLFRQTHTSSKLLLVGSFDTRDILPEEYKNEIERNPDIISTGQIEKSKLPLYYSLMDVFVFPSYREGFGMCVIEASAMEVPVLVSRSHGCIDSIREHQTGEYIDLSSGDIANGLEFMLDNRRRAEYGKNGRQWVVENFDHQVMWPLIKDYYISLAKRSSVRKFRHDGK